MKWNLNDLYSGIDDTRVEQNLDTQLKRAADFSARYREKIDVPNLDASTLKAAIEEYESIIQEADKPVDFAHLLFAAETSDPAHGAFVQKMTERRTEISVALLFFDLELMGIPETKMSELLKSSELAKYRHYLWAVRLYRDYRLTEPEEKVLEEKANTGRRAFDRLFDEVTSNIPFRMKRNGEEESLSLPQVVALLRDPNRDVRKAAAASLTEGLTSQGRVLTFIFNTLIQDKATDDRLRDYEYPEQSRHLANELDRETVELVVRTAAENYGLVSRYYSIKREILGLDKLTHYDRYAPLLAAKEVVPFDRAEEIVLGSFGSFSKDFADVAKKFFDHQWIDAGVRPGKRSGAFCSYITPDLHPYVLLSYLDRMDDVMTLAHELGHGVHAYVARDQGYLNFSSVLPLAELASTFGEMLVFQDLEKEASLESRLALYGEKIESMFATIFRQAAMFKFEQAIHKMRREKGELTTEEFSALWQHEQQAMFQDSVELGEEHRFWWMYVSHFIGSPFYVYAYTFGELLVLSLYAMYQKEGAAFPPKYLELLRSGGSMSPVELLSRIGVDIRDPEFWAGGMSVLEGFIEKFEGLYKEWKH
jgi:oligoendopeptidase F